MDEKHPKLRGEILNKTVALCLTAVLVAGLTSCSATATETSPTASAESPTAAATESAAPAPSAAPANTIPVSGVTTTSKGQYLQTTFDASEEAWDLDPAIVDPSAAAVDPAELLEGYRHILKFLAEEGIDSPLNGGGQTPAEWWADHEQDIAETFREKLRQETIDENKQFVVRETGVQQYEGYSYVYDPARTRLTSRSIAPSKVWLVDTIGTIAVESHVKYEFAVLPKPGTTAELRQTSSGTMAYSARKDLVDGKWRIDGYLHEVATTPAW
jgi:hypothetical protein